MDDDTALKLIEAVKELTEAVSNLAAQSRKRSISVGFADKTLFETKKGKADFIVTINQGIEVPADIDKKTYIEEFEKLKKGVKLLVEKTTNETLREIAEREVK